MPETEIADIRTILACFRHDARAVLANLLGQLEHLLAKKEGVLDADQRDSLEVVRTCGERLGMMIENLVLAADPELVKIPAPEAVDLEKAARFAVDAFDWLARKKGLVLRLEILGEDLWVEGSELLLGRLLDNLLSNALKFTPPGGQVTVRVLGGDTEILLEVEDNGCGIADEDVQRIFQLGQRGQSAQTHGAPGLGLGLAICQRIAEAHKARITVESKIARGSLFRVVFPG